MKQIIVMAATVLLGIYIFHLVAGPEDSSIYSGVRRLWQKEINVRTVQDY